MAISIFCTSCGARLRVGDHLAGRRIKCPECGEVVVVSAAGADAAATVDEPRRAVARDHADRIRGGIRAGVRPAAKSRPLADGDAEESRPRQRATRDDDGDEEEDRPRRKKKKKVADSKQGLLIALIAGGALLLIGGGVLALVLLRGGSENKDDTANKDKDRNPPDAGAKDKGDNAQLAAELRGAWRVLAIEAAGQKVPSDRVTKLQLHYVFDGNKVTVKRPDRPDNVGTFVIDSTPNPKRLTINFPNVPPLRAVYALEQGKLRLCLMVDDNLNAGYPAALVSQAAPKTDLLTLERAQDPGGAKDKGPGKDKVPPPPKQEGLAGSAWVGSETLKGFGRLEFRFGANDQATMIDVQETRGGTCQVTGNRITMDFGGGILYTGTITGQAMSGTASNGRDRWNWSVKRQ